MQRILCFGYIVLLLLLFDNLDFFLLLKFKCNDKLRA